MSEELKPCSVCKKEPKVFLNGICCTNRRCINYNLMADVVSWQSRPIEDALTATIAQKDAEIERLRGVLTNINIFDEGNISEYVIMSMKNLARNALKVNND